MSGYIGISMNVEVRENVPQNLWQWVSPGPCLYGGHNYKLSDQTKQATSLFSSLSLVSWGGNTISEFL